MSAEKVAIIASALDKVDRRGFDPADIAAGEQLLEHAQVFPPEDLRLLAAKVVDAINPDGTLPNDQLNEDRRYLHLKATKDGAYVGDFRLTGSAGAKLKTLLDPLAKLRIDPAGAVDERTYGQRQHDALEDLCDRQLRAGHSRRRRDPGHGDRHHRRRRPDERVGHGRTADGTLIPTKQLLQLANNAEIIPAVLTATGEVLDLGRSRRIASRNQTLALIARDAGAPFPAARTHPNTANGTTSGLRAAVLRRSEKTRFSVFERRRSRRGRAQSQRAERAVKHRMAQRRADESEQLDAALRVSPQIMRSAGGGSNVPAAALSSSESVSRTTSAIGCD